MCVLYCEVDILIDNILLKTCFIGLDIFMRAENIVCLTKYMYVEAEHGRTSRVAESLNDF